jgi:hypothetical protein
VRQVGVDLDERVVALLQTDREPGAVRAAEAGLRRPAQRVDVPSSAAVFEAMSAVPSGLLSSTTRMSAPG